MMPLRTRIFILISIVILLILGVSIFLLVRSDRGGGASNIGPVGDSGSTPQASLNDGSIPVPPPPQEKLLSPLELEQNAVEQLAKTFFERYGTFSSQNNFQNVKDVKGLVTASLWERIKPDSFISSNINNDLLRSTTEVAAIELSDWGGSTATVILSSMRTTIKNRDSATVRQETEVMLLKINGGWLVDSFDSTVL